MRILLVGGARERGRERERGLERYVKVHELKEGESG